VLCRENELGWRLRRHIGGGYTISRRDVPFVSRLWQWGPLFGYLALAVAFHAGADAPIRYSLYAVPVVLFVVWLKARHALLRCFLVAAPASPILYQLLWAKGTIDGTGVYAALVVAFMSCSPWVFQPGVLSIPTRLGYVTDWYLVPQRPFFGLTIDIRHDTEAGVYGVYLKEIDSVRSLPVWEVPAWESSTETEAREVATQFGDWGIGALSPRSVRTDDPVIKGDRKLCLLFISGYILSVVVFLALVLWMIHGRPRPGGEPGPEVLLRHVQLIMGFLFLSPIPLAMYLCCLGRRAIQHRQMPPPGMKLLIDTKALTGAQAVKRGRLLMGVGVGIVVVGLVGGLYVPHRLARILGAQTGSGMSSVHTEILPGSESHGLISWSRARAWWMTASPAPGARLVPRMGS